jgi:hypothetical protein
MIVKYIGINGAESDEQHSFLKIVEQNGKTFYFGLIYEGLLINPYTDRFTLSKRIKSKFVKISKHVYDNYMKFLETQKTPHLNIARRGLIG